MLALHLSRKFQADILHRHAELFFVVDGETDRLHFTRVIWIRLEMKNSRSLAVIQEAFAIDLAGVASKNKMHILPSALGKVHAREGTGVPVRLMARHSAVMMFDQRELTLARLVGLADRPIAAVYFRGPILHHAHQYAAGEY